MSFHPARRFWDAAYAAGDHLEHWQGSDPAVAVAPLLAPGALPSAGAVLDLGCGAGAEAVHLAECGLRVWGLDLSLTALALGRHRAAGAGVRVGWLGGDVLTLPVAGGTVDAVLDRGCLHLLERRWWPAYAREVHRVLAPGGVLLLLGARRDDEEAGLVGLGTAELDRAFPSHLFRRGRPEPIELHAPAGDLPAHRVLLRKR
jgi:SAM-dependent methyltransferase